MKRSRVAVLVPGLVLALTVASGAAFAAVTPKGVVPSASGLSAATLPTAAAHASTPHRPSSCPPLPSPNDPNTPSPGQTNSLTGTFPWPPISKALLAKANGNPEKAATLDATPVQSPPLRPANWNNQGNAWKYTSARSNNPLLYNNPQELCGVRGMSVDTAWQSTTGSPKTLIAVTDSGIEWCDPAVVNKIYLNRGALPAPENAQGLTKAQLELSGVKFADSDPYDLNNSGVFNVAQYANDPRVKAVAQAYGGLFCGTHASGNSFGYHGISPEDLILTFGTPKLPDGKSNPYYYAHQGPPGFVEAISGWNFVNNTNNPYDVVHYDHGTGEAMDSGGSAGNLTQEVGSCPNCMILPVRVGDSFVTTSNNFAEGVLFAVDSGANLLQEALGTVDVTNTARQAVAYAQAHGVPVIASAADEHAQHHNLPAVLSHTIVVNSVTAAPRGPNNVPLYNPPSYLYLNGCTNYGANVAVSVPSVECSSEATGKTAGVVGLVESAAAAALARGRMKAYPGLTTVTGAPVALSVNEVRQLVTQSASAIDFGKAALPFGPPGNYAVAAPYPTTRFPTHPGFTPYFGYGRLDASRLVKWVTEGLIPPQAEITNLPWFETLQPTGTLPVKGLVGTPRPCPGAGPSGPACHWTAQVQVGVGTGPSPGAWRTITTFSGHGVRQGTLATIDLAQVVKLFPAGTNFNGGPTTAAGQPANNAFTFTVRVVVQDAGSRPMVGMSTRAEFLHSAAGMVFGHPLRFLSSIDAAPTLAPLGPHGSNVLLVATTDGNIHALLPNGRELKGWPVHTALDTGYHPGEPAYTTGKVSPPRGSPTDISGGLAVGDLTNAAAPCLHSPHPNGSCLDVVVTDWTGRVYAWNASGHLLAGFPVRTNPAFSGPSAANTNNRVLPGFASNAALADLGGNGQLDVVAAAMDRHVYAWTPSGKPVPGWPVLVVDPSKVASVNPTTNQVTFAPGSNVTQGTKLMDTPAIGNLNGGGGPPDVVVGSNEEYSGSPNTSVANPLYGALGVVGGAAGAFKTANSRVYAIQPNGSLHPATSGAPAPPGYPNPGAFLPGWPASIADFVSSLLPVVGDGVTNSPALAPAASGPGLVTGVMSAAGPAYVLGANGASVFGNGPDGKPKVASTQPTGPLSNATQGGPSIPALGAPIFAPLGAAAPGMSLIAPALSLSEALNVAFPGHHPIHTSEVNAWSTTTGHFVAGFPQTINDMAFFDQPIVANVGGPGAGPYVVEGSATYDLRAVNALGQEAPGFPKFTGGWMVNSPSFGSFGTLRNQVLAAGTREGFLFVWSTPTPACASSGPWPMAHHDLWNTNNLGTTGAPAAPRLGSCAAPLPVSLPGVPSLPGTGGGLCASVSQNLVYPGTASKSPPTTALCLPPSTTPTVPSVPTAPGSVSVSQGKQPLYLNASVAPVSASGPP
ncbi:MAG: S8/S53 family peptidase [Acidimicrobiales bacterium]